MLHSHCKSSGDSVLLYSHSPTQVDWTHTLDTVYWSPWHLFLPHLSFINFAGIPILPAKAGTMVTLKRRRWIMLPGARKEEEVELHGVQFNESHSLYWPWPKFLLKVDWILPLIPTMYLHLGYFHYLCNDFSFPSKCFSVLCGKLLHDIMQEQFGWRFLRSEVRGGKKARLKKGMYGQEETEKKGN